MLWPFCKGIEHFVDPTPNQVEAGVGFIEDYHGKSDELAVSYPNQLLTGDFPTNIMTA